MPRKFTTRLLLVAAVALLCATWASAAPTQAPSTAAGPVRVRFDTTLGTFTIELDAARSPLSAENFLQYVRDRHYDGTIFHRIVGNFVVQGGGFTVDGVEKPTRPAIPNESGNGLSNRRGTVAMARLEGAHSATSQFFVNLLDNHALDPSPSRWGYAVIGRVVEGLEIIDRIASVPTGAHKPFEQDAPLEPVVIQSAVVVEAAAVPAKP